MSAVAEQISMPEATILEAEEHRAKPPAGDNA
jgi:hypothetical protein